MDYPPYKDNSSLVWIWPILIAPSLNLRGLHVIQVDGKTNY